MLRDDAMPCTPSVLSMPVAGDGGSDSRPPHLLPLLGGGQGAFRTSVSGARLHQLDLLKGEVAYPRLGLLELHLDGVRAREVWLLVDSQHLALAA